jgi:hypothetical protein
MIPRLSWGQHFGCLERKENKTKTTVSQQPKLPSLALETPPIPQESHILQARKMSLLPKSILHSLNPTSFFPTMEKSLLPSPRPTCSPLQRRHGYSLKTTFYSPFLEANFLLSPPRRSVYSLAQGQLTLPSKGDMATSLKLLSIPQSDLTLHVRKKP